MKIIVGRYKFDNGRGIRKRLGGSSFEEGESEMRLSLSLCVESLELIIEASVMCGL